MKAASRLSWACCSCLVCSEGSGGDLAAWSSWRVNSCNIDPGGTASEKQSHQNTARLHGRARKRWDVSVHRRCSRGQTAPLQTSFTLTPITACLVTCSSSRWGCMETASGSIVTPKRSDRCPPLFLQRVDSVSTHPTSHSNHVLFQMTAVLFQ